MKKTIYRVSLTLILGVMSASFASSDAKDLEVLSELSSIRLKKSSLPALNQHQRDRFLLLDQMELDGDLESDVRDVLMEQTERDLKALTAELAALGLQASIVQLTGGAFHSEMPFEIAFNQKVSLDEVEIAVYRTNSDLTQITSLERVNSFDQFWDKAHPYSVFIRRSTNVPLQEGSYLLVVSLGVEPYHYSYHGFFSIQ